MEDLIGAIVYSKAGRDKRKPFVIVQILEKGYVYISDGQLRKLEKPKKKKLKHLTLSSIILKEISQKIKANVKIFDVEIRKALEVL